MNEQPSVITDEEDSSGIRLHIEKDRKDLVFLNLGPAHPATHGTLRALCALDGETIVAAVPEMGYLHRGFEKDCETHSYTQCIPYTDRLNYLSAIVNNIAFCKTVEKMMGVDIPERAVTIRVLTSELNRIIDHLVCVGTNLVDLGAITNFWYSFNVRESVYDILEKLCGARLTSNYMRIGGVARDLYPGFEEEVLAVLDLVEGGVADIERLTEKNRIFLERTQGVAIVSEADAISYGWTGPTLRASGVEYDLRKAEPYYGYETYDFDVIVGSTGDTFDRIYIRMYEIRESMKIIRQALKRLKPGAIMVDDRRVALPPKDQTYGNIEGLMNHFKLIMQGVQPPVGEIYDCVESPNGELGFHIVSDGGKNPYRVKCRPPSFMNYAGFAQMIEGGMIADAIACLGSINIIAGELDR